MFEFITSLVPGTTGAATPADPDQGETERDDDATTRQESYTHDGHDPREWEAEDGHRLETLREATDVGPVAESVERQRDSVTDVADQSGEVDDVSAEMADSLAAFRLADDESASLDE